MDTILFVMLVALWVVALVFFRAYRIWIVFYTLGAVGLAFILVYIAQNLTSGQLFFQTATAYTVHLITNAIGIPTRIFEDVPGMVLVLVIAQEIGWTALEIGVESSGILEAAILVGLLGFYPGWSLQRKIKIITLGLAGTFVANIGRLLVIVFMLHYLGKDWLLFAHVLVGKVVFFVLEIIIFWYLLTMPTVSDLGKLLRQRSSV